MQSLFIITSERGSVVLQQLVHTLGVFLDSWLLLGEQVGSFASKAALEEHLEVAM